MQPESGRPQRRLLHTDAFLEGPSSIWPQVDHSALYWSSNTLGAGGPHAAPPNTCVPGAWGHRPRAPAVSPEHPGTAALPQEVRTSDRRCANDQIQR